MHQSGQMGGKRTVGVGQKLLRGCAGMDGAGLGSAVDVFLSDRPMRVGVFEVHQEGGSAAGQLRLSKRSVTRPVVCRNGRLA